MDPKLRTCSNPSLDHTHPSLGLKKERRRAYEVSILDPGCPEPPHPGPLSLVTPLPCPTGKQHPRRLPRTLASYSPSFYFLVSFPFHQLFYFPVHNPHPTFLSSLRLTSHRFSASPCLRDSRAQETWHSHRTHCPENASPTLLQQPLLIPGWGGSAEPSPFPPRRGRPRSCLGIALNVQWTRTCP